MNENTPEENKALAEKVWNAIGIAGHMAAVDAINRGETQARIVRAGFLAAFECALANGIVKALADDEHSRWPQFFVTSPPYTVPPVLAGLADLS